MRKTVKQDGAMGIHRTEEDGSVTTNHRLHIVAKSMKQEGNP
jgi:hypothetical protein